MKATQNRSSRTPAIVISTHTTGLAVIRALGKEGVPVYAMHYDDADIGLASKYLEERIPAPHPEKREEEFIGLLLDQAPALAGALVIPCSDAALKVVSRNKAALEPAYRVACPDWEIARRFLDKKYTYELAYAIGVPAPRTHLLRSFEDVERLGRAVDYPCLLKPCQGHLYFALFREKMARVENYQELIRAYRRSAAAGLEMVLQEYIPGHDSQGLNYNCYFWDGSPLVEFTAQKVMNAPPYLGSPCAVRSRPLAEVAEAVEAGRRLLSAGRLNGFACTEFKRDPRDGIYKLMEVNVRHNLSAELAIHCGVNFPWLQYRHLVEGRLPEPQGFKAGVSWIDLARYLKNCVRHFGSEFSLTQFLRLFLQPHVFADLHWSDPRPFARKLIRRRIRRAEVAGPSIAEPQGQPGMLV